jgi:5-methylthioribose kinase
VPYKALDEESVPDYVKSRPALSGMFPPDCSIKVEEVGDGNVNLVFIVENKSNLDHSDKVSDEQSVVHSVVLKQALPYLRVAGESWPLTRERMRFETQALLKYNELAPGLSPEVYDHDEEMSLVVMEHLGDFEIMRKPLVARKRFPMFVDHISTFMANTLFFTSDLYLTRVEKKELQNRFVHAQLHKIQEDFVFTNPYMDSPENNWNPEIDSEVKEVRKNSKLKIAMTEIKESYITHVQALIHGDLHTGSVMLNSERTCVIDPEFAFFGPMGFDIGAMLENLILNFLSHFAHTPDIIDREVYQEYLLDLVKDVWNEFARKFDELWVNNQRGELVPPGYWQFRGGEKTFSKYRRQYIQKVFQDTAGCGGAKMLRRIMGIVSVWDISSIKDLKLRAVAERPAIRIGSRWLLERKQITSIDDLIGIVKEETKSL